MSFPREASFAYERTGDLMHVKTHGLTNHELRNVLIGFWLTLSEDDRRDHIVELQHYLEPDSRPPGMSQQVADAIEKARA